MNFSTSCPACGASIPLTGDSKHISCPYCSRDFDVDLSDSAPVLIPGAGKPKEYTPPLEPEAVETPPPSPVIPDEVIPTQPEVKPKQEEPSYARFEPPASTQEKAKKVTDSLGKWLWVLIILLVLLCVTCVAGTALLVNWLGSFFG